MSFSAGLNIIQGPITTGKSSLLRLLKVLLGAPVQDLPPEIREEVAALGGELLITDRAYAVTRRLVSTPTALVEIAGDGVALRLPAHQATRTQPLTFGRWLMQEMGLPQLQVSTSRRRPSEGLSSPISINDYLLYCFVPQEEIDSMVLGHRDYYRDLKRRYVFEIAYGLYDSETALLEEQLRSIETELRQVQGGLASYERLLAGTAWENRTEVQSALQNAEAELVVLEAFLREVAERARVEVPVATALQEKVRQIEGEHAAASREFDNERASLEQLRQLAAQLDTQLARLTRSIVAGKLLLDFDFRVCPRCGASVSQERATESELCYLCLQNPEPSVTREALIAEQDRVATQLEETQDLIATRQERIAILTDRIDSLSEARQRVALELNQRTEAYVSDSADQISEHSRRRGELQAAIRQFRDYLELHRRIDAANRDATQLNERRSVLESQLEQRMTRQVSSDVLISKLETRFSEFVEEFEIPRFEGEPRAAIDRETYLPILNGRRFDQLSSGGLKVLTTAAYVLAHHVSAVQEGLSLPGILVIDGLTKNVGRDEYDWARVRDVFSTLAKVSDSHGDNLQIIVAANDIPQEAERFVRLRLSEDDRLVPNR